MLRNIVGPLRCRTTTITTTTTRTTLRSPSRGTFFSTHFSTVASTTVNSVVVPSLIYKTYHQLIEEQIKKYPFKDLFRSTNEDFKWTFDETNNFQTALAEGMSEVLGGKSGVALALPLRSEGIVAQISTSRANLPLIVLEPGTKAEVLEQQLKVLNPGLLLCTEKIEDYSHAEEILKVFPRYKYRRNITIPINDLRFPNLRYVFIWSKNDDLFIPSIEELLVKGTTESLRVEQRGITPDPKKHSVILLNDKLEAITLSEFSIINTGYTVGSIASLNEEDIVLTTLPLHRAYGLSLGVGLALSCRVKLVWCSELFNAQEVVNSLSYEYCTALIAQPDQICAVLDNLDVAKKNTGFLLKKVILASSPGNLSSPELIKRLKHRFGEISVLVTFGIDETSGVITTSKESEEPHVGHPLPFTEIQIVDSQGKEVKAGTEGELTVKGFNVTTGYRNKEEQTRQKLKEGFFQTGITAKLDKDNLVLVSK